MAVGADAHGVAGPKERAAQPVPCLGAFPAALYALAAWLRQCQMATVVLEAPGVAWMALGEGLEARGCDVKLVDPHGGRQGPGRTTDVKDGPWLQELHTSGLLRGALRPEDAVGGWRSSRRHRRRRVAMAARTGHPMQKAREPMPRKRTEVVSEIPGKPGMTILRALLAGARAPQLLATDRDTRCQHEHATLAQA
jgi:transposase